MTEESTHRPLSREELEQLAGEQLPERAAMSLVNANVATQSTRRSPPTSSRTERSPTRTPRRRPRSTRATDMSDYKPLTREDLTELAGEELPERAAMSLVNANVAAPVNLAAALNVAVLGQLRRVRKRDPGRDHRPGQLGEHQCLITSPLR